MSESLPSGSDELAFLVLPIPAVLAVGEHTISDGLLLMIGAGWCVITILVMFVASRAPFRAMREYYKAQKEVDVS